MRKPNEVLLNPASGSGVLASHLNRVLKAPDIRRARALARLLKGFHLKDTTTSAVNGRRTVIEGRSVVNFGSANYLGLEQHPEVLAAARKALSQWGNHSGCSRIFSSHENLIELELSLASLVGAESAIVYANTSSAHIGTIPALFSRPKTVLFLDRYAHMSMHHAALIAVAKGARIVRIDIRDLDETAKRITAEPGSLKVVLVDGVYSMQGTVPDLSGLQAVCDQCDAILYIDDAHGIAILGENGGGVAELFGLSFENMILVGGLQKGLGAYGGFVAGSRSLIDILRVSARTYVFSGTMQPQAVEGSLAAIRVCRSEEGKRLRAQLDAISMHVRKGLSGIGFEVETGASPIVSVLIGSELRTLLAGRKLFDLGVYVNSVLFPATPKGEGLLRISLNAIHTDEEIALLLETFAELKTYLDRFKDPRQQLGYAGEFAWRQVSRGLRAGQVRLGSWIKQIEVQSGMPVGVTPLRQPRQRT
jgi:8-amino-7-oxononanoate synthase